MTKLIWVKCKTNNYYETIKKVSHLNLGIYDIEYENKYLKLKISNTDYNKLTKYLKSYKFTKIHSVFFIFGKIFIKIKYYI